MVLFQGQPQGMEGMRGRKTLMTRAVIPASRKGSGLEEQIVVFPAT